MNALHSVTARDAANSREIIVLLACTPGYASDGYPNISEPERSVELPIVLSKNSSVRDQSLRV